MTNAIKRLLVEEIVWLQDDINKLLKDPLDKESSQYKSVHHLIGMRDGLYYAIDSIEKGRTPIMKWIASRLHTETEKDMARYRRMIRS